MRVPTDTRTAVGVSVTLLVLVTAGRLAQRAAHPTPVNIAQCPRLYETSGNGQTVLLVVVAPCW
jgi:hypothetical protein